MSLPPVKTKVEDQNEKALRHAVLWLTTLVTHAMDWRVPKEGRELILGAQQFLQTQGITILVCDEDNSALN